MFTGKALSRLLIDESFKLLVDPRELISYGGHFCWNELFIKKQEVERLLQLYKEFIKNQNVEIKPGKSGIDRSKFRDLLFQHFSMTDDILMDRMFRAFDTDNDGYINENEWVCGMSTFLKGDKEEQARFCFAVFSVRGEDGPISRDQMYHLLKNCLVHNVQEEDAEEMQKDLVDICIKKLDMDHDGKVSLDDYMKATKEDKLLLDCLGTCLPRKEHVDVFLELIEDDRHKMKF